MFKALHPAAPPDGRWRSVLEAGGDLAPTQRLRGGGKQRLASLLVTDVCHFSTQTWGTAKNPPLLSGDGITPAPNERHSGTTGGGGAASEASSGLTPKREETHERRLSEQARGCSRLRSIPPQTRWTLTLHLRIPAPKHSRNAPEAARLASKTAEETSDGWKRPERQRHQTASSAKFSQNGHRRS